MLSKELKGRSKHAWPLISICNLHLTIELNVAFKVDTKIVLLVALRNQYLTAIIRQSFSYFRERETSWRLYIACGSRRRPARRLVRDGS